MLATKFMPAATWYEQLNFIENPLDARPNPQLVGMKEEEDQLRNHILKEEICFLNGFTGAGKTSLLKRVQGVMPDHSFIYLDADALPEDFNLLEAVREKRNFLDKIRLRQFPAKKPVLIIDEFQATDSRLILEARSNWENPNDRKIRSIVIAQISQQLKNVPGSFKDRLGTRMITIKPLDDDDMKRILKLRLDEHSKQKLYAKISNDGIDLIIKAANGNARRLLEYTDMIFDFHFRRFGDINPIAKKQEYQVTYHAVKEILNLNNVSTDLYEETDEGKLQVLKDLPYEKMFSLAERNTLQCFTTNARPELQDLGINLHLSQAKCRKILAALEEKGAVIPQETDDNKRVWQITEFAKRVMVRK